jgi:hypothetical protein
MNIKIDTESDPGAYEDHLAVTGRFKQINGKFTVPEELVKETFLEENAWLTKEVERLKSALVSSRDRFVRAGMSTHEIDCVLGDEKSEKKIE